MSRSDIHELLMLKLTGGLLTSQLAEIDQLISSNFEVSNSWRALQNYYFDDKDRRGDFENLSVAELMSGIKSRVTSIRKTTFSDIIAFCWKKALAFIRMLSFYPDWRILLPFVNSNIQNVLNVLWTGKGHLSLEECRSLIVSIADNPVLMKFISPRAFEEMVGELYRNDGFHVSFTGKAADGGIDVVVSGETKTGLQKCAIQCKRYRAKKVGIEAVRSLYGVKVHGNFTQAVMVTTSTFTRPAILFSEKLQYELTLKNSEDVTDWCKAYKYKNSD